MAKTTQIVAATGWSKGGGGEYPSRYVILKWRKGSSAHPYSRHMQVNDGKHKDYYIYGHYHMTFKGALNDLELSVIENNQGFSQRNPSYIPPGVRLVRRTGSTRTRRR